MGFERKMISRRSREGIAVARLAIGLRLRVHVDRRSRNQLKVTRQGSVVFDRRGTMDGVVRKRDGRG